MIDVAELRRLYRVTRVRLLDRGGRDRRRALGRGARGRGHRRGPARSAGSSTSRRSRRCRCSGARRARRSSATSTPTRATRRSPASSSCGSTAACSSPARRRSRSASASSPRTARQPRTLVLDLEGVNFVDSQGAAKVTEIHELTRAEGVGLRLARVKPQVLAVFDGRRHRRAASAPITSTATSTARSRRSSGRDAGARDQALRRRGAQVGRELARADVGRGAHAASSRPWTRSVVTRSTMSGAVDDDQAGVAAVEHLAERLEVVAASSRSRRARRARPAPRRHRRRRRARR